MSDIFLDIYQNKIDKLKHYSILEINEENKAYEYYCTPLTYAIHLKKHKIMTQLLELGANPNQTIPGGYTPLMMCSNEQLYAAETLLEYGANINAQEDHGRTALHFSLKKPEILQLLIKMGANTNIESNAQMTPLEEAFYHKNKEAYTFLFDKTLHSEKTLVYCLDTTDYTLICSLIKEGITVSSKMIVGTANVFCPNQLTRQKILKKLIMNTHDIDNLDVSLIHSIEQGNLVKQLSHDWAIKKEQQLLKKSIKNQPKNNLKKIKI